MMKLMILLMILQNGPNEDERTFVLCNGDVGPQMVRHPFATLVSAFRFDDDDDEDNDVDDDDDKRWSK